MSQDIQVEHDAARRLADIRNGQGRLLFRYVYASDAPAGEAPRPYAHPVCSPQGDVLTNFRPNDHPWHHGLSMTLTSVNGVNFWGGPTHRAGEGYRWRDDQGAQVHRAWIRLSEGILEHELDWVDRREDRVLLRERRRLAADVRGDSWSLRWTSELLNASGGELTLGNYHALSGLAGSHYTGLQFRGARALLDDHGDEAIAIRCEGGLAGEAAVHGAAAKWMEWDCQNDTTLARTRIRFENVGGDPLYWFVRRHNPLAAFAFHRETVCRLGAGATLTLDHRLTFSTP